MPEPKSVLERRGMIRTLGAHNVHPSTIWVWFGGLCGARLSRVQGFDRIDWMGTPCDRTHRLRDKADEVGLFRHAARFDPGVASWVSTQPGDVGGAACVDRFLVPGDRA